MQTFLPYPSFELSLTHLDRVRLGNQRLEAKQILSALLGLSRGWVHHPATKMWRGYEGALCEYGIATCTEWVGRGFHDTLLPFFVNHSTTLDPKPPKWLGVYDFHASHRANLLRKNPEFYNQFGWSETPTEGYWWPTKNGY